MASGGEDNGTSGGNGIHYVQARDEYARGRLDELSGQVTRNAEFANSRMTLLDAKIEAGFRGVAEKLDQFKVDFLAMKTSFNRQQGALGVFNQLLGWVAPALIGASLTYLVYKVLHP
jgi:hypothetical protein